MALAGIGAVFSLHHRFWPLRFRIPGLHWQLEGRFLIEAVVLVLILGYGVYLYNKPTVVDFLIDTEHELRHRVTWPQKKEEVNASIVVVVTVLIMMGFIFGLDSAFSALKTWIYKTPGN
jgi:preprotein translocase SecE subunit